MLVISFLLLGAGQVHFILLHLTAIPLLLGMAGVNFLLGLYSMFQNVNHAAEF